jgi:hypothetical protein
VSLLEWPAYSAFAHPALGTLRKVIVFNSAIHAPASAKSLLATLNKHSPRLLYRADRADAVRR